jgi:metallophosphoesterase (TIGR03768 family)
MARPNKKRGLTRRDFVKTVGIGIGALKLSACGGGSAPGPAQIVSWPIANRAYTTAQQQVLPVALPVSTPPIKLGEVSLYAKYGYSSWKIGGPLSHEVRKELAPSYTGAPNVARLLSFFSISDIHTADKESPAQPIYVGWNAPFGPSSAGLSSAYSPILLSTPHVLDAAIQTINALHTTSPFDFGMSLGDAVNNTQYDELRWFIDVIDGKVITPSSGAHAGAHNIDYQKPFKAVGVNPQIPWYQVLGNHDQFWMGSALEDTKTRNAHVSNVILNMEDNVNPSADAVDKTGAYMGVVDGSTYYGDIVGAGPENEFPYPPIVVPDANRHSLSTPASSSFNWMNEFFSTSSNPVGHGFSQSNLDQESACYSFLPKSGVPIKIIVLDDTVKGPNQPDYAAGDLDQRRFEWLKSELQAGQDANQLMIIAAHVPVKPQNSLTDTAPFYLWPGPEYTDDSMVAFLHGYPNLILWMAGHRHVNVVTLQSDPNNPGHGFWEVETSSLRDFPQQFRTWEIRRNGDNTISILITNVDPAVSPGSPAAKSRGYAIGAARIFGATPAVLADTTSHAYNAELVIQLTPAMQAQIANVGSPLAKASPR